MTLEGLKIALESAGLPNTVENLIGRHLILCVKQGGYSDITIVTTITGVSVRGDEKFRGELILTLASDGGVEFDRLVYGNDATATPFRWLAVARGFVKEVEFKLL